ncbi:hypothetical protein PAPYR_2756 [Paratrimastix pyriformis]|uniref:RWD domain-containing protein n=1 Tax=Paratrimastix pyriformis TaxID=342808 RepID=A0ABQ8UR28_9EUKA|nr:hypothetical protein PAPYR_2756 [Paratrimastix pyriformis]
MSEDALGEIEALRAIFDQLITAVSEDPPSISIKIVPPEESGDAETRKKFSFCLVVTYPPKYPEQIPQLRLSNLRGVQETDGAKLVSELEKTATEAGGAQVVFGLIDQCKEWLVKYMATPQDMHSEMIRRRKAVEAAAVETAEAEAAAVEAKTAHHAAKGGTPVTVELFLQWRERFEAEQRAAEQQPTAETKPRPTATAVPVAPRLTGRQLFEQDATLVNSDAAFFGEGEEVEDMADIDNTVPVEEEHIERPHFAEYVEGEEETPATATPAEPPVAAAPAAVPIPASVPAAAPVPAPPAPGAEPKRAPPAPAKPSMTMARPAPRR